ncbi:uncharacterized protein ACBR49_000813 [Aulostomus maculatus]
MQGLEMSEYVNHPPGCRRKYNVVANQTERKLRLLLVSFGVLCLIQAALNLSLRLTLNSSEESSNSVCNKTSLSEPSQGREEQGDCGRDRPAQCNRLQERFNALTRDRDELRDKNNKLMNALNAVQEERDRLKARLKGYLEKTFTPKYLTMKTF